MGTKTGHDSPQRRGLAGSDLLGGDGIGKVDMETINLAPCLGQQSLQFVDPALGLLGPPAL